jgi:subtilisin family serine protease
VAGIAALVRSAHPDLDADNVINRIIKTARPPPRRPRCPTRSTATGSSMRTPR